MYIEVFGGCKYVHRSDDYLGEGNSGYYRQASPPASENLLPVTETVYFKILVGSMPSDPLLT